MLLLLPLLLLLELLSMVCCCECSVSDLDRADAESCLLVVILRLVVLLEARSN